MRITADEGMRWYESPSKGSADAELQRALLALGARTGGQFLAGLLGNRSDSITRSGASVAFERISRPFFKQKNST